MLVLKKIIVIHCNCNRADYCSVLPFWLGLNKVINGYLDSVTLSELARQAKENNAMISCQQNEKENKKDKK